MRFFFAASLGADSPAGPAIANTQAKQVLSEILGRETPRKPYSDAALEEMLRERGIPIARRTIAKYRTELGILPAHLRKRT